MTQLPFGRLEGGQIRRVKASPQPFDDCTVCCNPCLGVPAYRIESNLQYLRGQLLVGRAAIVALVLSIGWSLW